MSQRKGAAARTAATLAATLIGVGAVSMALLVTGNIPAKTMRTLRLFGVNQCLHLEKT